MSKPLIFSAASLLDRLMGRRRYAAFLTSYYRLSLELMPQGRVFKNIFQRVLASGGRPPASPERLNALLDGLARVYASNQLSLFTMDRAQAESAVKAMDLKLLPALAKLREAGKGVILSGPHFGNQVLAMTALAMSGVPVNVIFIYADPFRWAEEYGLRVINLGEAALECLRALTRNEVVLLYTDLDYFPGGRTADFFGAPVRPPHGPARLSLASGAPILPVYALCHGEKHSYVCDKPIMPEGKSQEAIESALLRSQESFIAKYPDHWWNARDIWDMEETERQNARHLASVMNMRRMRRFLGLDQ